MNKISGYPSFRRRLLANMPEDVANSFTELQLTMIEHALEGGRWHAHPLDIRVSVPVLWKRFYLVLLAGPERRSAERRKYDRAKRQLRVVADTVVFALFLLLLIPAVVGTVNLITLAWPGQ